MKKILPYLLLIFISARSYSQCTVSANTISDASCMQNNGSVELTFAGGITPYFVNFNSQNLGTSSTTLVVPDLASGNYFFSTTDANGTQCTGAVNISVGNTGVPTTITFNATNPSCQTCPDGSVSAGVIGGSAPYSFQWDNSITTSTLNYLLPGTYHLTVVNADGCVATDSITLIGFGINYHYIQGTAFYDINLNGVYDSVDAPIANQQVQIQPSGNIVYTNSLGQYLFADTLGNYTVSYIPGNNFHLSSGNSTYNVTLNGNDTTGLDFAILPDSLIHQYQTSISCSLPRCNTIQPFLCYVTNTGTVNDSLVVDFTFDANMTFLSSSPLGVLSGQTVTFTTPSIGISQTVVYQLNFSLPGAGNTMNNHVDVNAFDSFGTNVFNSSSSSAISILCSFDPNEKAVSPEGVGPDHLVLSTDELQYLIRFQNTGNDTAFTITVTDTLDANLDLASLRFVGSSHTITSQELNGRVLSFTFDNIQLPDSVVDEPSSHGYVVFTIRTTDGIPNLTPVYNSANIYFDQNAPVITNTTMTTFTDFILGLNEIKNGDALLFPNPIHASGKVSINSNTTSEQSITLIDLAGRVTYRNEHLKGNTFYLNIDQLANGIYFARIADKSTGEIVNTKIVIEK